MIDNQCYQWIRADGAVGDTPTLGRRVHAASGCLRMQSPVFGCICAVMMPLYSNIVELVPETCLRPYPSEPIPTP